MAAAIKLNELPLEMLREIGRHLNVSEKRAWRRADKIISQALPVPKQPPMDWIGISHAQFHYARYQSALTDAEFIDLCRAAYGDDAMTFQRLWNVKHDVQVLPILTIAVAMGDARRVWRFMVTIPVPANARLDYDMHHTMLIMAACQGRFEFIRQELGLSANDLLAFLRDFDGSNYNMRFEKRQRHPVVLLLKRRHFSHVAWLLRQVSNDHVPRAVKNACIAHGYIQGAERFLHDYDQEVVPYAIGAGDTSFGLRWLELHRPDLFGPGTKIHDKPYKMVHLAAQKGCHWVLEWLNERQAWDLQDPKTGYMIYDLAVKNKSEHVLRWLKNRFRSHKPEWYAKRVRPPTPARSQYRRTQTGHVLIQASFHRFNVNLTAQEGAVFLIVYHVGGFCGQHVCWTRDLLRAAQNTLLASRSYQQAEKEAARYVLDHFQESIQVALQRGWIELIQ